MKENKNVKCDPCERDFEHKIKELVDEGKSPSHEQRQKREHEVKAAFNEQHPAGNNPMPHHAAAEAKMHHSAAHAEKSHPGAAAMRQASSKPAEKHPVGAGAGKMKK